MKTWLCALALGLLLPAMDANAIDINRYMSGSWYNPEQVGHGFSVEIVSEDVSVFYWYVYNPDGTPTFLMGVGNNVGDTIHAVAYHNEGMHWGEFDPGHRMEMVWGELEITFRDCDSATLSYASSHHRHGIPAGSGEIQLTRLLSIDHMQCADNAHGGIYQGTSITADPFDKSYYPATMVLTPEGKFYAFSHGGEIVLGDYAALDGDVDAQGTVWLEIMLGGEEQWISEEVFVTGRIQGGHRAMLNYSTLDGGDAGNADLYAMDHLYRRGIRMSEIRGDWRLVDIADGDDGEKDGAEISITGSGNIIGSDPFGCVYTGDIEIPDTRFNLFEITVTVTECEEVGGTFTGIGYQFDAPDMGEGNTLRIIVASDLGAAALQLVP